ncbi:MAG: DnaD domain protein [Lachnospira sp.]
MGNLTLTTKNNYGYTAISNIFISSFVPEANGEFVKVYLYLLHLISTGNSNISISLLADTFNQTEADIMRALRYWDKLNVISLTFAGNNDSLSNITINDFSSDNSAASTTKADFNNTTFPETANLASSAAIAPTVPDAPSYNISEGPKHVEPSSMQYSAEKISELNSDENFSMLLYVIESYLGRPLSIKETNAIVYFYDSLDFSIELIDYLFEYCVEHNKKSINYIEKVALAWADKGIHTVTEAKEEVSNHTDSVYQIMKAFGISNRDPGQHERAMISKWADTYCFDTDIIIEACNRTIKAIHQPSFEYADTILSKWKSSNITTMADIKKDDAAYAASSNNKTRYQSSAKTGSTKFNNFQQRDKKSDDWYNSLLSNNN